MSSPPPESQSSPGTGSAPHTDLAQVLEDWIARCYALGVTDYRRKSTDPQYQLGSIDELEQRADFDIHPDIYTLYRYWPDLPIAFLPGNDFLFNPGAAFSTFDSLMATTVIPSFDQTADAMSDRYRDGTRARPVERIYFLSYLGSLDWFGIECAGPARGAICFYNDGETGWAAPALSYLFLRAIKLVEDDFCYVEDGVLRVRYDKATQIPAAQLITAAPDKQTTAIGSRNHRLFARYAVSCVLDINDIDDDNIEEPNLAYAWRW